MVRYNYSKYNTVKNVSIPWIDEGYQNYSYSPQMSGLYQNITIERTRILFHNPTTITPAIPPIVGNVYFIEVSPNAARKLVVKEVDAEKSIFYCTVTKGITSPDVYSEIFSRGSFIQTVQAENGTYPNDGQHSDGYWYVRESVVNTAPTTPGTFTQPTGDLEIGDSKVFTVGAATDAENNLSKYIWEASINGGAYAKVGESSTPSFTYTIPTATSLKMRVKAVDYGGLESGYRESTLFTVKKKNATPALTVNTADNRTLYENDVFSIEGSATDTDNGNIVNVKYTLDGGTVRALATAISTGANAITFAKSLTFKGGKLYDGETALTDALTEGTAHILRVWAEDDQGGKSAEQTRSFYVVANRPPALTIDAFSPQSSLINSDKVTLTGSVNDPENQTVVVKYKIGGGNFVEVYNGANGAFSFDVKLADLQADDNQITVQAVDPYGATASKIVKLSKAANATKLLDGVQRYKVQPPKGTAKGLVIWVQAETGDLTVSANVSMTAAGVQEDFKAMTLSNTAPVGEGVVEYEFTYQTETAQENVVIELRMHRNNAASTAAVKLVSGVLL